MNLPSLGASPGQGDSLPAESRVPQKMGDLQKAITMAQIAKAAGVSQGAISSLLNDRDYGIRVSEKTRERVFKVCREMGYLPNDLRAVVRMYPEMGDHALLVSSRYIAGMADPLVARMGAALVEAMPEADRRLTIASYDESLDYLAEPARLPQPVTSGVVSKFLFLGRPNASLLQSLSKRGFPAVILGHEIALPGVECIVPDFAAASRMSIERLFELGHQRLAIVSAPFGSTDPDVIEFNRGIRMAYEKFGVAIDAQNILYGDLSQQAGATALASLLERPNPPSALFCMSDAAAAGVLGCAQRRGLRVPGQLSVIGCSDDPIAALLQPALTTVRLPITEMATRAIQECERLVRLGTFSAGHTTLLPVQLVERDSCAPFTP